MITGEPCRQVVLARDEQRLITWLPTRGLKRGIAVGDLVVETIYELTLIRCPACQRLCAPDVTQCLCPRKS